MNVQQKRTKRQIQQEYSDNLQQEAQREKQEVIDNLLATAALARKANAERKAAEEAHLAKLRKQNELEAEDQIRQTIAARYSALPKADFERLYPQLRDEYLLVRSRELNALRHAEYSQFI